MSVGGQAADPLAQSPYFLPEPEAKRIFEGDIGPYLFSHGEPRQHPCVVVLIAQPGAGKTAMTWKLREDFAADGGAVGVGVEVDGLKGFHPDLTALQRTMGEVVADEFVQADARRWQDMALDHLRARRVVSIHGWSDVVAGHSLAGPVRSVCGLASLQVRGTREWTRRVHVVVEQFPRSREMLDRLVGSFADAGYEVRAALLTTPLAQSLQGVLPRYQQGRDEGGGRDVPPEKQAERFGQVPEIIDWLQSDPRVSAIALYRRDGTVVHRNARDPGSLWRAGSSREALADERRRTWTVEGSDVFLAGQASLTSRMDRQWGPRVQAAAEAAQGFLDPSEMRRSQPVTSPQRALPGHRPTPPPPTPPASSPPKQGPAR